MIGMATVECILCSEYVLQKVRRFFLHVRMNVCCFPIEMRT